MVYLDDTRPNLNDPARCLQYSREYLNWIALFHISYPLRFFDPAAAASARESVRQFKAMSADARRSVPVTSRRGRALWRLAGPYLPRGSPNEAREVAVVALDEQRKAAARDPKDLQEAALLTLC